MIGTAGCDRVLGLDRPIDAPPDIDQSAGLVAFYKMEQVVLGTVPDEIGPHQARCIACPVEVAGKRDNALAFDGMSQLLRVTSTPELRPTGAFTVTLWINFPMPPQNNSCPIGKVRGTGDGNSWQICLTTELHMALYTDTATGINEFVTGNAFLQPGIWHHVALKVDGTRTLFVGGFADKRDSEQVTLLFDDSEVLIGGDLDDSNPAFSFAGAIDDVRIYDRALSDDDIFQLVFQAAQ